MASAIVDNIQLANLLTSTLSNLFGSPGTTSNVTTNAGNFTETRTGGAVTRSGGDQTTTERLDISKEGIDALLRDLMEDDSTGFARVASGQKLAGLYNTTSRNMLLNDLLTRSAGQVAKLTAPKITSTTSTPQLTTTAPHTTTRVSEPTTQTTTGGGKEGLLTLDNVGKTAGLLGLISLAGKGKDLLGGLLGAIPSSSLVGSLPYEGGIDAVNGLDLQSDLVNALQPVPSGLGEVPYTGGVDAVNGLDLMSDAAYSAEAALNEIFPEITGGIGEVAYTGGLDAVNGLDLASDAVSSSAASSSWTTGLPIAFAVANADKIGEAYGSIGREVGDFIGGIFGMTGNEPWSQEAQDEWDRLYAPFVGSQQGGLG